GPSAPPAGPDRSAGAYLVQRDGKLFVGAVKGPVDPRDATFVAEAGLADPEDPQCFSLLAADGRVVRHSSFRLILAEPEDKQVFWQPQDRQLFREDATFCARGTSSA